MRARLAAGWRRLRTGAGVVLVLLVVSGCVAGLEARTWQRHRDVDRARQDAIAAATQVSLGLADLDFSSAGGDISAILDRTTGPLRQKIIRNRRVQSAIARQYRVRSVGKVEAAGLVRLSQDSAVVAVAMTSQVASTLRAAPRSQWFRVAVTVQRQVDGRWLASDVEFVR